LIWVFLLTAPAESRIIRATVGRPWLEIEIPDATYSVRDYGAVGDGKTNDTAAVQKTIDTAAAAGGGTVSFPSPYKFLIAAIHYSGSKINLDIASGATLLVSNDKAKWPGTLDVITAKNYNSITITGGGTIDGQGEVWWATPDDFRPRIVYWSGTSQGLISNVLVKNCPNHCLEMYTNQGEVANVTITNPPSTGTSTPSHNTDAVDIHGQPFYVHDCHFSTGDDNIAAHNNDTLVENCVFGDGHGASIGSVCNGYIKNVTFNKITFNKTTTAMRIKTDQGCGGFVKQITYSNLEIYNVGTTVDITMYYANSSSPTTLVIDGVTITNVNAYNSSKAGDFTCVPESACHHITLKNFNHVSGSPSAFTCSNAYGTASNVTPSSCLKPEFERDWN